MLRGQLLRAPTFTWRIALPGDVCGDEAVTVLCAPFRDLARTFVRALRVDLATSLRARTSLWRPTPAGDRDPSKWCLSPKHCRGTRGRVRPAEDSNGVVEVAGVQRSCLGLKGLGSPNFSPAVHWNRPRSTSILETLWRRPGERSTSRRRSMVTAVCTHFARRQRPCAPKRSPT